MNNYPENDYRLYLQHGTKGKTWTWPDHKYLYVDKNGNYVYPRDIPKNAARAIKKKANSVKSAISNAVSEVKSGNAARNLKNKLTATSQKLKTTAASFTPKNIKRNFYKSTGNELTAKNVLSAVVEGYKERSANRKQKRAEAKLLKQEQKVYNKKLKNANKTYKKYLSSRKGISKLISDFRAKRKANNVNRKVYRNSGRKTIIAKYAVEQGKKAALSKLSTRDSAYKRRKQKEKAAKQKAKSASERKEKIFKTADKIEEVLKKIPGKSKKDYEDIFDIELNSDPTKIGKRR